MIKKRSWSPGSLRHLSYSFPCLTRPFSLLCRKTKSTTPSPDFEIKGKSLIHASGEYFFSEGEDTAQSKLYFMDLTFSSLFCGQKIKRVKTTIRKSTWLAMTSTLQGFTLGYTCHTKLWMYNTTVRAVAYSEKLTQYDRYYKWLQQKNYENAWILLTRLVLLTWHVTR